MALSRSRRGAAADGRPPGRVGCPAVRVALAQAPSSLLRLQAPAEPAGPRARPDRAAGGSHGGRLPQVAQPVVALVRHRAARLVGVDGAEGVVLGSDVLRGAWEQAVWTGCLGRHQGAGRQEKGWFFREGMHGGPRCSVRRWTRRAWLHTCSVRRLNRDDLPTLGSPQIPIRSEFLTRPKRAAPACAASSFLGGMTDARAVLWPEHRSELA